MFDFNFRETRVDYDIIFFFLNYKYKYINKKEYKYIPIMNTKILKPTKTKQNKRISLTIKQERS